MQAIEFETDVVSEYIRIPEFEKLKNRHVKVIVLSEEDSMQVTGSGEAAKRRKPATVPLTQFYGDVLDTVPTQLWDQT